MFCPWKWLTLSLQGVSLSFLCLHRKSRWFKMAKAHNFQMTEIRWNQVNLCGSVSKYFLCCKAANFNIGCALSWGFFFWEGGWGEILPLFFLFVLRVLSLFFKVRCNFSSLIKIHLFLECKTSWSNILHEKWCDDVDRQPRKSTLFPKFPVLCWIVEVISLIYFSISCVYYAERIYCELLRAKERK